MNYKIVSLLYSGGCDSTLSAAILARDFDEIHLVTFKHYSTWNIEASRINAAKLQNKFKKVKFKHVFLNSTRLFLLLQKDFLKDLRTFRYLNLYFCGACKLAMHSELIIYNLRNNIRYAASGASSEMSMFPDQNTGGIGELEKFYNEFNITLQNPVFFSVDTDKVAFDMNIFEGKHFKKRHRAKTIFDFLYVPFFNIFDNIQGFCLCIGFIDLYIWLVKKTGIFKCVESESRNYYRKKIDKICKSYIDKNVASFIYSK